MRFTGVLIEHLAAGKWRGLAEVPKGLEEAGKRFETLLEFHEKSAKVEA